MADQTAIGVLNDMIDTLAGEHVEIPETIVPALLVLSGYISNLGGDIEEAVANYLDAHPEATTTVQDGSITARKFADGVFTALTDEQIDAMF